LKPVLRNISTIIFDLGGVLLDLNTNLTIKAFAQLSGLDTKEIISRFHGGKWSYAFEKGEIDAATFRNEIRTILDANIGDTQIDQAWNAMLLDIPLSRLEIISQLKNKYQLLVLSNTNSIHVKMFDKIVSNSTNGGNIENYFDEVYYSHKIGMRKPDNEVYAYVIETNNLIPEKTLFIDDMEQNIIGAQSAGLKTVHLTNQDYLPQLFLHE
jgi:glucose-1-phosphatase